MTRNIECLFCDLVAGNAEACVVFNDVSVMGVLTIRPKHVGHVLLFPKEHVEDFALLDRATLDHLFRVAARLKAAICAAVPCAGFQVLINQGPATGQRSDCRHLHVHLLPRSLGVPVDFDGRAADAPRDELEETARKISRLLNEASP